MIDDVIDRYWYAIDWDVATIWALELPVDEISVDKLVWQMDVPVWPDAAGAPYTVTPNQVLQNIGQNRREYERVLKADLRYPIEVFRIKQRLMILDGIHRLARTIMLGSRKISVRFVPENAVQTL
ncbi:MAG: hypothetical protein ACU0CA_12885 [Paracoccaceae bacterium]